MLEATAERAHGLIQRLLEHTRVSQAELERPTLLTTPKIVLQTLLPLLITPPGIVLFTAFLLLMAWGFQGNLHIIRGIEALESLGLPLFWAGWGGTGSDPAMRDQVIPGLAWDQELICFIAGVGLLVVLPALIIRFVLHRPLSDFGLGLPPRNRRLFAFTSALGLGLISLPAFLLAAGDSDMKAEYPLFRGAFVSDGDFLLYELAYLLFFVTIEFVFRGYLLFGLYSLKDSEISPPATGIPGPLFFGYTAILIAMLSYTAWHLGKPQLELWGTIPWGLATGAIALASRSILPIILVHWSLNVFLDLAIRSNWSLSSLF